MKKSAVRRKGAPAPPRRYQVYASGACLVTLSMTAAQTLDHPWAKVAAVVVAGALGVVTLVLARPQ